MDTGFKQPRSAEPGGACEEPWRAFSFSLETLSSDEREQAKHLVRRGIGGDASDRAQLLFRTYGHSLFEYFQGSAPAGLQGVQEPLEWYRGLHSTEEWEVISSLSATLPPLEKECLLSVCIPVAAAEEPFEALRTTLAQFANQSLSAKNLEVVLFFNWPEKLAAESLSRVRALQAGVIEISQEYPSLALRVLCSPIPEHALRIGFLRKILHDVVVARELARGDYSRSLLHFRGDADTLELPRRFLEQRLRLHERNPHAAFQRGEVDYALHELKTDPALFFGVRLDQVVVRWLSAQLPDVVWGGMPNVSVTSARYAAVSGYSRFDRKAEDAYFDFRAAAYQETSGASRAMRLGARQRIKVSARRLIAGVERGIAPACLWVTEGSHAFEASSSLVRSAEASNVKSERWNCLNDKSFDQLLRKFINDTVAFRLKRHSRLVPRLCAECLPHMGITAVPQLAETHVSEPSASLEIQSIAKLKEHLRSMRDQGFTADK